MSRTYKNKYNKTNKYKSNRFSGWSNFKLKPFGLAGYNYYWQKFRNKDGSINENQTEDCCSEINKTGFRMKLKRELKKELYDS